MFKSKFIFIVFVLILYILVFWILDVVTNNAYYTINLSEILFGTHVTKSLRQFGRRVENQ